MEFLKSCRKIFSVKFALISLVLSGIMSFMAVKIVPEYLDNIPVLIGSALILVIMLIVSIIQTQKSEESIAKKLLKIFRK